MQHVQVGARKPSSNGSPEITGLTAPQTFGSECLAHKDVKVGARHLHLVDFHCLLLKWGLSGLPTRVLGIDAATEANCRRAVMASYSAYSDQTIDSHLRLLLIWSLRSLPMVLHRPQLPINGMVLSARPQVRPSINSNYSIDFHFTIVTLSGMMRPR